MQIKDLMTKNVLSVKPTDTVNAVADVLAEHHFTGVPVVDDDGKLLGTISERDFIASDSKLYLPTYIKILQDTDFISGDKKRLPAEARAIIEATAEDIMNRSVITADPEMTLEQLAELFAAKRVNPIPVVDKDFNLLGIVSRSDLIKLFSQKRVEQTVQTDNLHRPIDNNFSSNLVAD
jgi:CBS domain-containing protein